MIDFSEITGWKDRLGLEEHARYAYQKLRNPNDEVWNRIYRLISEHDRFCRKNFSGFLTSTHGRMKNLEGFEALLRPENFKKGREEPDYLDIVGYRTIIDMTKKREEKAKEDICIILGYVCKFLEEKFLQNNSSYNENTISAAQASINNIEAILSIFSDFYTNDIRDHSWNNFYDFEKEDRITTFQNPFVLLVERITVEIKNIRSKLPKEYADKIIVALDSAIKRTDYGASIHMSNAFSRHINKIHPNVEFDPLHSYHIVKPNGFAQCTSTFYLLPDYIPIEQQIRTGPNERIATSGTAAHGKYKTDKALPVLDVNVDRDSQQKIFQAIKDAFPQAEIDAIYANLSTFFSFHRKHTTLDIFSLYGSFIETYHKPDGMPSKPHEPGNTFFIPEDQHQFYELALLLDAYGRFDHKLQFPQKRSAYDVRRQLEPLIRAEQQRRVKRNASKKDITR